MTRNQVPPELLEKIKEKTKLKKSQVYNKIQKEIVAQKYSITKRIAAFLVAIEHGINIKKYLDDEDKKDLSRINTPSSATNGIRKIIIEKPIVKSLEPLRDISPVDPFLPSKLLDEAKMMAEKCYPLLYIFENTVRNVINFLMEKKYGKNWWDTRFKLRHSTIDNKVSGKMNDERQNRWASKRGIHKIYYTELDDLRIIIEDDWPVFKVIHSRKSWVIEHIMQLNYSRNIIAHNNPLRKRDITSIDTKIREWLDQIKDLNG